MYRTVLLLLQAFNHFAAKITTKMKFSNYLALSFPKGEFISIKFVMNDIQETSRIKPRTHETVFRHQSNKKNKYRLFKQKLFGITMFPNAMLQRKKNLS